MGAARLIRVHGVALLLVCWLAPPAGALETADEIRACVRGNLPQQTSVETIELESIDRAGGRRTLQARLHWKRFGEDEHRLRIRVEEPSDLRGASYLVDEKDGSDDMFMYLPALRKVRRITSGMLSDSLWGTDFSYEDVKQLQGISVAGDSERLADATVADRATYVLALRPASSEASSYAEIRSWVDRETCVVVKTEFFERGDVPRKVLTADPGELAREGGRWSARSLEMRDLQGETTSHLRVLEEQVDVEIPDRTFNPTLLGRGH